MIHTVRDVLRRYDFIEGTEFELRVTVPPFLFNELRTVFVKCTGLHDVSPVKSNITFSNRTDLRQVDGSWQRKRVVHYARLPIALPCRACVCVESPCAAPPSMAGFNTIERTRWSYSMGSWCMEWTMSSRSYNVELEYTGDLRDLMESASREDSDLCGIEKPFQLLAAHTTCLAYGPARFYRNTTAQRDLPLPRAIGTRGPISCELRRWCLLCMSKAQPVSLYDTSADLSDTLVSLKNDGVRVAMVLKKHGGLSTAWLVCRAHGLYSIPCLNCSQDAVLDCEFIVDTKEIVIFDVLCVDGRRCEMPYIQRLERLSTLLLPSFSGFSVRRKEFYPSSVISSEWYNSLDKSYTDGLIIHDKDAYLAKSCSMYKWKQVHTVDLEYTMRGNFVDTSRSVSLPCVAGHGKRLNKGHIWECSIEGDMMARPLRYRKDKSHPNTCNTCKDIFRAHKAAITIDDLRQMAQSVKKRKHDST